MADPNACNVCRFKWALDDRRGFAPVIMIPDSTPHRIFKISELTRVIASHLVLISPKSAVDLACTCRYIEEPALSTLWETQWSLCILLKVLPEENWKPDSSAGEYLVRSLGILPKRCNA